MPGFFLQDIIGSTIANENTYPAETTDDGTHYLIDEYLSSDMEGDLFKGRDLRHNSCVVVKKIKVLTENNGMPEIVSDEIKEILSACANPCPYITRVLNTSNTKTDQDQMILNMFYDFSDSNYKMLSVTSEETIRSKRKNIAFQAMKGLEYLHRCGVIHGHLGPRYILVDPNGQVKITDYGLARSYDNFIILTDVAEPNEHYQAPELLLSWKKYHSAVDIWSMGSIIGSMYNQVRSVFQPGLPRLEHLRAIFDVIGCPPVEDWPLDVSVPITEFEGCTKVPMSTVVPEICSDGADLLERMLTFKQGRRITARDALQHPFFKDCYRFEEEQRRKLLRV